MKLFTFLFLTFALNSWAMNRVPLMTGKVYVPEGYDSNDLVEVMVLGSLPDSCHRSPTYEISKEGNTITVHLFAYYVQERTGCRKFSIPYQETINLGLIPKGQYKVQIKGAQSASKANLKVVEASSSLQDDFQYGNVMNIEEDEDTRTVELVGTNPTNCLVFDGLVSDVQNDVIVLRPRFKEQGECKEDPTEFSIKYEVPYLPNQSKGVLLHVRVMGGRSLNYLFHNRL